MMIWVSTVGEMLVDILTLIVVWSELRLRTLELLLLLVVILFSLHLDNKLAMACVDILRVEDTAIVLKAAFLFVPAVVVEVVEVIAPFKDELVSCLLP